MKKLKIVLSLIMLCAVKDSLADYGVSFVHITCIPEIHLLKVEFEDFSGSHVGVGFSRDKKGQDSLKKLWEKNGYFNPSKLTYECKFPEHTYRLVTVQPEPGNGHCGVQPPVNLSLYENEKVIIKNVFFGSACSDGPTLNRVDLSDPPRGWGYRELYLWLALKPHSTLNWKLLSDGFEEKITSYTPIDQSKIILFSKEIQ